MKKRLAQIFSEIKQKEKARIEAADSNPDKWYELFIISEDGSTQTVKSADTLAGIIDDIEISLVGYEFDRFNIDIWENKEFPVNIYHFFKPIKIKNDMISSLEQAIEYIREQRKCDNYDLEQYRRDIESRLFQSQTKEGLLYDFDIWKEQSDIEIEKIIDMNHWGKTVKH